MKYNRGQTLLNAAGDIDIQSTGFKYAIDSMTEISAQVIDQKFFRISPADFMDVDEGYAAWKSQIVINKAYLVGGDFHEGFVNQGNSRRAQVNAALGQDSMPIMTWAKKTGWTLPEIEEAANVGNWDVVYQKLKSLKTDWDLGVQAGSFLGFDTALPGFLNQSMVNINTTRITGKISAMDATEFQALVAGMLNDYYENSNETQDKPNILAMPMNDYLGMAAAPSPSFPVGASKLKYLKEAFSEITGEDFQIKGLTYANSDKNADGKNRYTLYRKDPEVLKLYIPVGLTMNQAYTNNGFDFEQLGYGQVSGVFVTRPREMLYFDLTAST